MGRAYQRFPFLCSIQKISKFGSRKIRRIRPLKYMTITPATLTFLLDVAENNNREWFAEHKPRYQEVHDDFKDFAAEWEMRMLDHDEVEKLKVYRIYRDVRFSKNKTPYKTNFGASLNRVGAQRRGGYYFQVEPGDKSFMAAGFWGPNKEDLKLIRDKIAVDPLPLRRLLANQKLRDLFGDMRGDKVKTAPKGFSKDDPAIDLLRYKQFLLIREFSDEEVLADNFIDELNHSYESVRPFFDYMSDVLTTDMNGRPL
ncbi:MAG: DUF2461 domain-containing protein [Bacteroidia bacterium]|nr:DUF2461 domain-containing protein [Bacteroidia bacterium]